MDHDDFVFKRAGVAKHRRHGGGGAIGGTGYGVGDAGRDAEYGGAFGQVAVLRHATDQNPAGRDLFVAELHQALALGPQSVAAVEALAATPHHGPGDAVAEAKRPSAIIARAPRTHAGDLAHHFVAQYAWHGRVAPAGPGMQVAAANGGAPHAHQRFGARQHGNGKPVEGERLAGGTKHRGKRSRWGIAHSLIFRRLG